jgi:hypothetical protein
MGGSTNTIYSASGLQLPVPHLKLVTSDSVNPSGNVSIEYDNGTKNFTLVKYPIVTALDLSQEQIDKGVYVEMAHYRRGRGVTDLGANEAGYAVPAPQIAGANPLGNRWTRGGSHIGSADRPNHYKVTSQNEQIQVWEYLKNRHFSFPIQYYDTVGGSNQITALIPRQGYRNVNSTPGKTYMYSSRYRPYYFMFRYIMWDDDANNWVSGPWSKVIKLTNEEHPFQVDGQQSAILGRQVGNISPLFNKDVMKCWFETRLP